MSKDQRMAYSFATLLKNKEGIAYTVIPIMLKKPETRTATSVTLTIVLTKEERKAHSVALRVLNREE